MHNLFLFLFLNQWIDLNNSRDTTNHERGELQNKTLNYQNIIYLEKVDILGGDIIF